MFRIRYDDVALHIEGCPRDGLEAIDFRRALGIEGKPTSLECVFDPDLFCDEALCRLVPDILDKHADLVFVPGTHSHNVDLPIATIRTLMAFEKRLKRADTDNDAPALTEEERAALTTLITKLTDDSSEPATRLSRGA